MCVCVCLCVCVKCSGLVWNPEKVFVPQLATDVSEHETTWSSRGTSLSVTGKLYCTHTHTHTEFFLFLSEVLNNSAVLSRLGQLGPVGLGTSAQECVRVSVGVHVDSPWVIGRQQDWTSEYCQTSACLPLQNTYTQTTHTNTHTHTHIRTEHDSRGGRMQEERQQWLNLRNCTWTRCCVDEPEEDVTSCLCR